jgi:flagellar assembly factor FliW
VEKTANNHRVKIQTRRFGEIEVEQGAVLHMPLGLPGFPGKNRYVLIEKEDTRPFCWLQSIEDAALALVVMNPLVFKSDYTVELASIIETMNWTDANPERLLIYVVVNISAQPPRKITANLIGPIVINPEKREAVQIVIYDSPYSHQYPVLN